MTPVARGAAHTAVFYAAVFGAFGAHLPFWPLWLETWGLSAAEIGAFTALGVATRVVAGLGLSVLADRLGRRRQVLAALAFGTAAVFALHAVIETRAVLLAATLATGAALSGIMPLGEALGAGAARDLGFAYAPARAAGSLAFLATNLALGALIAGSGADAVLVWLVVCLGLTGALALRHPGGGTRPGAAPPDLAAIVRLLVQPVFLRFTLAAALCMSSHAVFYAYGSVHWRALGLSEARIGALWAVSVAVEIGLMLAIAPWALPRLGAVGALAVSGAAGVIRWTAMAADPGGAALWLLQGLHALTFAAGHLGAIAFIQTAVPDRFGASAQGAVTGLAGGVLTAIAMGGAALVYPHLGGQSYLLAAALSAAGLLMSLSLARYWSGGELRV